MKICIYGAGAIGGWIGTRLAASGHDVSVVARGATLKAIEADGLRLESGPAGQTQVVKASVRVSDRPAELGPQDLVVVAVKAPGMVDVARGIAPLLGPETMVLTAMNGVPWWFLDGFGGPVAGKRLLAVDPKGEIARAIDSSRVIGCVVHASCSLNAPGFVRNHFGNRLIIGEPAGGSSTRLLALGEVLRQAGHEVEQSQQIQKDVWYKLWGNMTVNPISALTGATTDKILADELVLGFISSIMLEARAIGERIGIPIAEQPEDRHVVTRKLGAFKTSMLQDVEAHRAVELDALVTVVRELGQFTGVPTPCTDILLGLARLQARVLGLYP